MPTEHHRATYAASGVDPAKLVVVPEPVDVEEFNPEAHEPLALPRGAHVFGPSWPHRGGGSGAEATSKPFVFLSVFKWEQRKVRD